MERHCPADLAPIYAELAALRAGNAARAAESARVERRRRLARHALPLLLATLLVALVPLSTLAANPFNDLNPGSVHNANIDAIYNVGITTGCDATDYCPNRDVTREEMASFLARTAGLGGNPPIANAKTATNATNATNAQNAQNAVSAQNATNATNATNAAQLGGVPATGYVQANNHFLPIAFGTIDASGTIDSGSGNFTVSKLGTGHYEITIAGVAYMSGAFTTVATLSGVSGLIRTTSTTPAMDVFTSASNGSGADRDFQFVTYKP